MVTSDDDSVTDIVVEGDKEEIERLAKVSTHMLFGGSCDSMHLTGPLGERLVGLRVQALLPTGCSACCCPLCGGQCCLLQDTCGPVICVLHVALRCVSHMCDMQSQGLHVLQLVAVAELCCACCFLVLVSMCVQELDLVEKGMVRVKGILEA